MITTLTLERLTASVLAVPPLCRHADFTLNAAENTKLIRHMEGGGISTLLYGGNANFYHVGAAELHDILSYLASAAGDNTLVIPSVGPAYGTLMDQAPIVRRHRFPTVMVLPMQGASTPEGIETGIRRFVDAAGVPALLYVRAENYVTPAAIARLYAEKIISGVKYAVVRKNAADDPYLRAICQQVNPAILISGLGEQPAITHLREFHLGGFTSGVVCVGPRISAAMLRAARSENFAEAERLRELCLPLETLRNAGSPIRVLHEAVRLAGIANTGPLLPLLSNIPEAEHGVLAAAAKTLLEQDRKL